MQLTGIAQYLAKLPPDLILLGDFNNVAWGPAQSAFRTATGLENRGHLALTWPTWMPWPLRLPIDQVFTGGDLVVHRFVSGPAIGSDHLPVEAEIAAKPQR
jgi:endonuclease/exonuclease/phosphatase (EEP) superfamily protein YafD